MKILWLGGVFNSRTLKKYKAVNQAANKWSIGLLNGLKINGCEIDVLAHRPEQSWPRGKMLPGRTGQLSELFEGKIVRYVNWKPIRQKVLMFQYKSGLFKRIKEKRPDIMMCYNPTEWNVYAMKLASQEFNIPWVPVILDYDDPGDEWSVFRKTLNSAYGYVFLSYWGYINCPTCKPILHLDGGNEKWHGDCIKSNSRKRKKVLYAGKYNKFAGIELLLEIAEIVANKNEVELLLCGKNDYTHEIKKITKNAENVKILGFLDEKTMHQYHCDSDLYLNVRPPGISDNRMIFPSKIVNYLSYGKPVVGSWTDGLSPEYRKFLFVPERHNSEGFYEKIMEVSNWEKKKYQKYNNMVRPWFEKKTWNSQTFRLVNWLEKNVISECREKTLNGR